MKPCPFCGCLPFLLHDANRWALHPEPTWYVCCHDCDIRGPASTTDKDDAVRRWNLRCGPEALPEAARVADLSVELLSEINAVVDEIQKRHNRPYAPVGRLRIVDWRDLRDAVTAYQDAAIRIATR